MFVTFSRGLAGIQKGLNALYEIILFLLEVTISNEVNRLHFGKFIEGLKQSDIFTCASLFAGIPVCLYSFFIVFLESLKQFDFIIFGAANLQPIL
jgi:hypothetical protein